MSDVDDLKRHGSQRLHLLLGNPPGEALQDWKSSVEHRWGAPPIWAAGDLLLSVLATKPLMLMCLERAALPSQVDDDQISVEPRALDFAALRPHPLIQVQAINERMKRRLAAAPATLSGNMADAVLQAIEQELVDPTPRKVTEGACQPTFTRERSTGLKAQRQALVGAVCEACARNFGAMLGGRGVAALEVHHLKKMAETAGLVATSLEDVVLLCGACHNLIHHATGDVTVEELRYEWRPGCPKCEAKQAKHIVYGLPNPEVPMALLETDWFGGDVHFGATWSCGECSYQWGDEAI